MYWNGYELVTLFVITSKYLSLLYFSFHVNVTLCYFPEHVALSFLYSKFSVCLDARGCQEMHIVTKDLEEGFADTSFAISCVFLSYDYQSMEISSTSKYKHSFHK